MTGRPTLFALSSGRPPAAIAIIRISGPAALDAVRALTGRDPPAARKAVLRTLRDPASGDVLDRALVLVFPGPRSATGEDLVELHLHGGMAVVGAVLRVLATLAALQPAEAGAFTRRAFENGVMDLPQVEGLADLLAAETERQRRQAIAHADGHLTRKAEAWRERLLDLLARIEADLDFSDEEDVGEYVARDDIAALADELDAVLRAPSGERLREGVRLAIIGPPNAGKSSLINALTKRDVAIVTPVAGTTRDRIEAHLSIGGIPFVAIDTAGLRETGDVVEQEGIARSHAAMAAADIIISMADDAGAYEIIESKSGATVIPVRSKNDLLLNAPGEQEGEYYLSALTEEGMPALTTRLVEEAERLVGHGDILTLANERQRRNIAESCDALRNAETIEDPVLAAEHVRQALVALGRLTGRVGVEDMLDALFGRFCIGK